MITNKRICCRNKIFLSKISTYLGVADALQIQVQLHQVRTLHKRGNGPHSSGAHIVVRQG